jgi:hypothetical protein
MLFPTGSASGGGAGGGGAAGGAVVVGGGGWGAGWIGAASGTARASTGMGADVASSMV